VDAASRRPRDGTASATLPDDGRSPGPPTTPTRSCLSRSPAGVASFPFRAHPGRVVTVGFLQRRLSDYEPEPWAMPSYVRLGFARLGEIGLVRDCLGYVELRAPFRAPRSKRVASEDNGGISRAMLPELGSDSRSRRGSAPSDPEEPHPRSYPSSYNKTCRASGSSATSNSLARRATTTNDGAKTPPVSIFRARRRKHLHHGPPPPARVRVSDRGIDEGCTSSGDLATRASAPLGADASSPTF
jgi:hypothetical protein